MMMDTNDADIRASFSTVGLSKLSDDVIERCIALQSQTHLTASQLAEVWEAFSISKSVAGLDDHTFRAFRNAAMKHAESAVKINTNLSNKRTSANHLPYVTPPATKRPHLLAKAHASPSSSVDQLTRSSRVSLSPNKISPPALPPTTTSASSKTIASYADRKDSGKVLLTFNPSNAEAIDASSDTSSPHVSSLDFPTNVDKPFRHMFTTTEEKSQALDNLLTNMAQEMQQMHGFDAHGTEVEAVGVPRQDKVICIGRICNEAHTGRMNHTSVLLEGSRQHSAGARIQLDLTEIKQKKEDFSLFPGQVVAVEGLNVTGRKMIADRIWEGASYSPRQTKASELLCFQYDVQNGQSLKVLSASGPFTSRDDMDYQPLIDLMAVVSQQKPNLVILTGPFVDINHPQLQNGDFFVEDGDGKQVPATFETLFADKIAGLIEDFFENDSDSQTQFVLVPSLQDATSEPVYPQAPFTDRGDSKQLNLGTSDAVEVGTLGLHYIESSHAETQLRVIKASNPCTLQLNEIVIAITSNDVLFQIGAEETNANLRPGSRLSRISQHLLSQRSFYPLFPPAKGVSMDMKQADRWQMPCQPDMLIIPSKFSCFARALQGTLVVNPGHLTKGTGGGTYSVMTISPVKRDTLEDAAARDLELPHALPDRVNLKIVKI